MKTIVYYHKNSDVLAFKKETYLDGYSDENTYDEKGNDLTFKDSNGYSYERTYDENGNVLTYKNSDGVFIIKGKSVSEKEFKNFINNQNRPCVGKKVVVDGIEYELK